MGITHLRVIIAVCAGLAMSVSGTASAEEGGVRFRGDGQAGTITEAPPTATRSRLTPAELRALGDRKPPASPHPAPQPAEPEQPPVTADGLVRIVIDMEGDDSEVPQFHAMPEAERMEAVRQRAAGADARAQPLKASLGLLRAVDVRSRWLTGQVSAMVPVTELERIRRMPGVKAISFDSDVGGSTWTCYTGEELRAATRTAAFHAADLRGDYGSRNTGRMALVAATIDWNNLVVPHVAFDHKTSYTTYSRIWRQYECTNAGCTLTSPLGTAATHGTYVAGILLGNIENGQDTAITDPTERVRRSGQAPEALLLHYSVNTCEGFAHAVQQATEDGADVINASMYLQTSTPSNTFDCAGINAVLRSALAAGVPLVFAAGNNYSTTSVVYPANRPEVIAVGALDTRNAATPYRSTTMAPYSNGGRVAVRTASGVYSDTPAVGVVAPGNYELVALGDAPNSYDRGVTDWCIYGTSMAAPATSGLALLLQQAYYKYAGAWRLPGYALMLSTLMLGDGWDNASNSTRITGLADGSGAGRLRGRFPGGASFTGPWDWRVYWVDVANGDRVCWPVAAGAALPSYFTTFKWVVGWEESDLQNVADIDLYLEENGWPLAWQNDLAIRNRIELTGSQLTGRSLQMCVAAYSIPAGQTRRVYSASLIHSEAD